MTKAKETPAVEAEGEVTVKVADLAALNARMDRLEAENAKLSAGAPSTAPAGKVDIHGDGYVSTMKVHSASENPKRTVIKEG